MQTLIDFVIHHGLGVLIVWVFAEQVGLPIPAMPILLAAGALAGSGHVDLPSALGCAVLASMIADSLWFQLGRLRGIQVLRVLCRISLEPDSCVRRTEDVFTSYGARSLLFAKFVPGLNTVAPPMAGVVGMRWRRFLFFDGVGAALWAGVFLGLGYVFSEQIEEVATQAESTGSWAVAVLGAVIVGYFTYKVIARWRFLRELRVARMRADDLKARLDSGERVVIVDLRHAREFEAEPETIPGALRIDVEELQRMPSLLPRDRDIVLFCT